MYPSHLCCLKRMGEWMKKEFYGYSKHGGVYKIINQVTGMFYIGSAKCFQVRASQHLSKLKQGKHANKHLQNAFNKHGKDVFLFKVVEVVDGTKSNRFTVEQNYINKLINEGKWEQTFNFKKKTEQKERSCFSRSPNETKKLLSQKSKAMWAKRSQEEKQRLINILSESRTEEIYEKVSKSHKANTKNIERLKKQIKQYSFKPGESHPNFGKENKWGTHTEEAKSKIKNFQKGRNKSAEQIMKQSGDNHWTKKRGGHTKDSKEKMRKSHQKYAKRLLAVNIETGKEYEFCSLHEAERILPVTRPNISAVLAGKRETTKGWKFSELR